jgi:hypothetical protein
MKYVYASAAALAAAVGILWLEGRDPEPRSEASPATLLGSLPVHFEPLPRAGAFIARRGKMQLTLDEAGSRVALASAAHGTLALQLEGATPRAARPEGTLPGVSNYFVGNDPRAWRTRVPHYARVRYEQVYPGIDVVYYGAGGALEYDFLVAAGADPARIRLRYEGADRLRIDDAGNLRLEVAGGEVVHHKPVSYQVVDGVKHAVESAFRVVQEAGRAIVSFELGAYDARLPLTIDPVLSYASYLGGTNNNESVGAMAVDAAGAVYLAGFTNSIDFPVTGGAFQGTKGATFDCFVAKINPAGTALEYATYLGGGSSEAALSLRIDAGGNAFVAGRTNSANFPTTAGAAQITHGGNNDLFVSRLNATGTALLYSTYLGGSEGEPSSTALGGFEIDAAGNAYVYADTQSANFPVSAGAPQPTRGNPNALQFDEDVTLTRLNAAGTQFTFSTYLGGTGIDATDDIDVDGRLFAIDGAGNAWVAGTTESADFPASAGAFDTTFNGPAGGNPGGGDAFVARYDTNAGTKTFATVIGGTGDEFARALAVDPAGNAYLASSTSSNNYPVTAGAFDSTYAAGTSDAAVTKLNPTGSALTWSSYLGGGLLDSPTEIDVSAAGIVTVAGETRSTDFPVTAGAADVTHNGGADGFIARFNNLGTALQYATFAGGGDDESVYHLAVDAAGSAYAVLGDTTGGAVLAGGGVAHAGDFDDYFVKLHPNGGSFLDATYFGGLLDDFTQAMTVDAAENIYLAGLTASSNYPVTAGVFQPVKAGAAGSEDMFIAKFSTTPAGPVAQPGTLAFSAATFSVGEAAGTASVTVSRSGGTTGAVSATCTAASGGGDTAVAGSDYTSGASIVSWADGDAANKTCSVAISNDAAVESAETFTVTLSAPTGGASLGAPANATVTITDDDTAPVPQPGTVQFNPAAYTANENGGSVTLTLTRTAGADGAISVSVASGGGSASAGADYTALAQTVSWADGDAAAKTVALTVADDATDEADETVTLMISAPTGGATLGMASATVTIVDNDVTPPGPGPVTQPVSARGKYGGALDGGFVAVLCVLGAWAVWARQRRRTLAVAAVALAGAAGAQAEEGWYVGARAGIAETTQQASDLERGLAARGHDVSVDLDDSDPTYSLLGGYRWANGLALEGGWFELGEYEVAVSGTTTSPGALLSDTESLLGDGGRGVSAAIAWNIPLGQRLEVTPRIGGYYWDSRKRVSSSAGSIEDHEFGVDLYGGVTLACKIGDRWKIGVSWEAWAADGRNDVRSLNAEISYRFGE